MQLTMFSNHFVMLGNTEKCRLGNTYRLYYIMLDIVGVCNQSWRSSEVLLLGSRTLFESHWGYIFPC